VVLQYVFVRHRLPHHAQPSGDHAHRRDEFLVRDWLNQIRVRAAFEAADPGFGVEKEG
jgi:hypothetical protein